MAHAWTVNGSLPNDPLLTQYVDTLAGPPADYNLAFVNIKLSSRSSLGRRVLAFRVDGSGTYKIKMCGYEGGYSPSLAYTGMPNVAEVYNFRRASKMVADVGSVYFRGC